MVKHLNSWLPTVWLPMFLEKHLKILHDLKFGSSCGANKRKPSPRPLPFPLSDQNPLFSRVISFQFPGYQLFITSRAQKYRFVQFLNEIWWYQGTILFPYRAYTASLIMKVNKKNNIHFSEIWFVANWIEMYFSAGDHQWLRTTVSTTVCLGVKTVPKQQ